MARRNAPIAADVYVRCGHQGPLVDSELGKVSVIQKKALLARSKRCSPAEAMGLSTAQPVAFTVGARRFPFSLEFPRRVAAGQSFSLVGIGTAGTLVRIVATPQNPALGSITVDQDYDGQPLKLKAMANGGPLSFIGSFVLPRESKGELQSSS
jgi:hypothetical protein